MAAPWSARPDRLGLAAAALLALAGCEKPGEAELRGQAWVPRELAAQAVPVWCYRTIGTSDCYANPVGDVRRLIPYAPP